MTSTSSADELRAEAERQLGAAAERHREVMTSMRELGRPESGQHVAVKSVGRAVHLVSFALKRAAEAGVPFDRLVELTGREPDLVREGLERAPEPRFVARLLPAGADAPAVAEAAASFEALARLHALAERMLAEIDSEAVSPPLAADLDDLSNRLEIAWRTWREGREGRGA
jgi:hypothetical protein